jgi:hypothetical protein
LAALVEMVSTVMYDRRRETVERARDFKQSVEMHQRVYRAIRAHKPDEARAAMHEHLELAQQAYASEGHDEYRPAIVSRPKPAAIGAEKLAHKDGKHSRTPAKKGSESGLQAARLAHRRLKPGL